jgi:hypothetical protein
MFIALALKRFINKLMGVSLFYYKVHITAIKKFTVVLNTES